MALLRAPLRPIRRPIHRTNQLPRNPSRQARLLHLLWPPSRERGHRDLLGGDMENMATTTLVRQESTMNQFDSPFKLVELTKRPL